jgi:hypothetical protein
MSMLKVILFTNGVGADAATYRPESDDRQWWNRRDALVRCVAAFLLGPSCQKELILVYDQDWSTMRMEYNKATNSLVPTERTIIALWKRAAKAPGESVEENGLSCRLVLSSINPPASSVPSSSENKRELLEYLQKNCSIDFLRQHK